PRTLKSITRNSPHPPMQSGEALAYQPTVSAGIAKHDYPVVHPKTRDGDTPDVNPQRPAFGNADASRIPSGARQRSAPSYDRLVAIARTVEGHHRPPPCAVGILSASSRSAIAVQVLPDLRSSAMRLATACGTSRR